MPPMRALCPFASPSYIPFKSCSAWRTRKTRNKNARKKFLFDAHVLCKLQVPHLLPPLSLQDDEDENGNKHSGKATHQHAHMQPRQAHPPLPSSSDDAAGDSDGRESEDGEPKWNPEGGGARLEDLLLQGLGSESGGLDEGGGAGAGGSADGGGGGVSEADGGVDVSEDWGVGPSSQGGGSREGGSGGEDEGSGDEEQREVAAAVAAAAKVLGRSGQRGLLLGEGGEDGVSEGDGFVSGLGAMLGEALEEGEGEEEEGVGVGGQEQEDDFHELQPGEQLPQVRA